MRCLTCPFGTGDSDRIASKAHLLTSALLSEPRHQARYPASYPATAAWRSRHGVLVSCRLSSTGIGLLSILFPPESSALLTVGYQTTTKVGPDSVGVSVFHTRETRPGWVPSLLRGGGVLPTSAASLVGACRFSAASPAPRWNLPSAELLITKHAKIHSRSPVRHFPSPATPGWNESGFGFYPGLRTPRLPTTHARAGTVLRTLDRITPS
jgi:hypothetical protein